MNTYKINELAERYFAGETTHEEEGQLIALIHSEGVQQEYRILLEILESKSSAPIITEEDEKIVDGNKKNKMSPFYWIGSVAAAMLLLIGVKALFSDNQQVPSGTVLSNQESKTETSVPTTPQPKPLLAPTSQKEEKRTSAIVSTSEKGRYVTTKIEKEPILRKHAVDESYAEEKVIAEQIVINQPASEKTPTSITKSENTYNAPTADATNITPDANDIFCTSETKNARYNILALSISGGTKSHPSSEVASSPQVLRRAVSGNKSVLSNPIRGRHYMPWNIGVDVRYNITKRWSVEAGIAYTHLKTELLERGSDDWATQRLHYVGIPLKADYKFHRWNNFTCYASAGGMIEKCVCATIDKESFSVPELQYSAGISAGIEYNIDKNFSVYFEPGISYFFDNNDNVKSIRKASPLAVNITSGLRVNLNHKNK